METDGSGKPHATRINESPRITVPVMSLCCNPLINNLLNNNSEADRIPMLVRRKILAVERCHPTSLGLKTAATNRAVAHQVQIVSAASLAVRVRQVTCQCPLRYVAEHIAHTVRAITHYSIG